MRTGDQFLQSTTCITRGRGQHALASTKWAPDLFLPFPWASCEATDGGWARLSPSWPGLWRHPSDPPDESTCPPSFVYSFSKHLPEHLPASGTEAGPRGAGENKTDEAPDLTEPPLVLAETQNRP